MTSSASVITHPIALCAYVLALVFGLLAKRWNTRNKQQRQLFLLSSSLAIVALLGGLALAWHDTIDVSPTKTRNRENQASDSHTSDQHSDVTQSSSEIQSPNIANTDAVSIEYSSGPGQLSSHTSKKKASKSSVENIVKGHATVSQYSYGKQSPNIANTGPVTIQSGHAVSPSITPAKKEHP